MLFVRKQDERSKVLTDAIKSILSSDQAPMTIQEIRNELNRRGISSSINDVTSAMKWLKRRRVKVKTIKTAKFFIRS